MHVCIHRYVLRNNANTMCTNYYYSAVSLKDSIFLPEKFKFKKDDLESDDTPSSQRALNQITSVLVLLKIFILK